ncbi:MAG TPA: hypothetical protein VGX96_11750 [Candidatus Elarobacter sp.]|jgi:hypothetical protein|nr:hypothetical protein [Candidatus Elarobacter sp.]
MRITGILLATCLGATACGGGGGSAPAPLPANQAAATTAPAPASTPTAAPVSGNGFAPTSLPLKVSAIVPSTTVDRDDAHVVSLSVPSNLVVPPAQKGKVHFLPVQSGAGRPAAREKRPSTFVNSPFDVSYFGGFVVGSTVSHNIYVSTNYRNCASTCWGIPGQFVADLGASSFIGHLDQYIGSNTANRYTKGNSYAYTVGLAASNPGVNNPVISQDTLLLLVYYVSLTEGSGYGHIFHVFLHPGLDTCVDFTTQCYSPDNPQTFTFCAYHSSVNYGGGELLYTVEPYADVRGCGVTGGANTQNNDDLIDSTANNLSHEIFETITDPNGDAWWNYQNGDEIGDPCRGYRYSPNLNGTLYTIQSEYSNIDHACIN